MLNITNFLYEEIMSGDDIIYLILLLLSIPYGHLVKHAGNAQNKRMLCLSAGLFMVALLVGWSGLHSAVTILGNFLILKLTVKYCREASFLFTFSYLFFFRVSAHLRFPQPMGQSNAVQLLVTLRMVSVAFEYYDAQTKEDDSKTLKKSISLFEIFTYGYCYIGLMTGPFYTYKTFTDMLHSRADQISTVWPAVHNLKQLAIFIVPYILLNKHFPIAYLESEECLNHGVAYIIWTLVPTFTWFRWRFYIGWSLAESMCMTCGLGAYPTAAKPRPGYGPTLENVPQDSSKDADKETHDFETIHNIVIYDVEFAPSMRAAMKVWNMTVQWWMANYVYKKLPIKSSQIRMVLLLFVSAFWHGVYPGYYFTFLSVALVVMAETRMSCAVTPYLSHTQRYYWNWVTCFCLYRSFEYLGVAFMLLKLESIYKVWRRVYFIGHVFIVFFILLPMFIPKKRTTKHNEKTSTEKND